MINPVQINLTFCAAGSTLTNRQNQLGCDSINPNLGLPCKMIKWMYQHSCSKETDCCVVNCAA